MDTWDFIELGFAFVLLLVFWILRKRKKKSEAEKDELEWIDRIEEMDALLDDVDDE